MARESSRYCRMRLSMFGVALGVFLGFGAQARADYTLRSGDVIEIAVAGVPELRQRVTIQMDGSIAFPLLGTFKVAGLPPSEACARIRAALETKVFRQRAPDGRESAVVIESDQVTASVVQYQPVYISGNVVRPGEQPYRTQMTVRQAVAVAGGYGIAHLGAGGSGSDPAGLKGDLTLQWIELVNAQVKVWRLQAELEGKGSFDQRTLSVPLPPAMISQIVDLEAQHLRARLGDQLREKDHLRRSVQQADEQIAALTEQLAKEEQGVQADAQELQKSMNLYGSGALTSPRVTDARRAVLLSSTRRLQTSVQLMQLTRQRSDLLRQIERLAEQNRLNVLRELQEALVKLGGIQARLQTVTERLQAATMETNGYNLGPGKPEITIVRKLQNDRRRLKGDEDTELLPGDVVEVFVQSPITASASLQ